MSNAYVTQAAIADFFDSVPNTPTFASGDTIKLDGVQDAIVRLAAGTYKIEPLAIGRSFIVVTTGAVVITNIAGTTLLTIASGRTVKIMALSTTTLTIIAGFETVGYVAIPLSQWREVVSNDIAALATAGTTGSGGVLATDTTPALEYVNGDTDSSLRIRWASSNNDPIVAQFVLPPDFDDAQPILFKASALSGGITNSPVISLDSYFRDGAGTVSAKIEDDTSAAIDSTDIVTATIAASDVPAASTPLVLTIELTPGAHTTDTLDLFETYIQYTRKF